MELMQVLMIASKQSQDGTDAGFDDRFQAESDWNSSSILTCLEAVIKTCMKLTSAECTVGNS
jgi:hypothetical protein